MSGLDMQPFLDANHSSSTQFLRHIKDPIHGHIHVSQKLNRFIDTKQFQRLRSIKQLGGACWVWPSGSHTRFEHCLGVAHLARQTVTHLQRNQPDLQITDRDVDCVEIAGLCHDLGHGPFSHLWEQFIARALPGSAWKHEQASEMMFDALVRENKVPISVKDQDFVKALIAGKPLRTPHEKGFLFDIVTNDRNGIDVDKVDYIHRDSHMVGDPIHLSPLRLINSSRVLDDQICYNIKDANRIYELCASRFKLHNTLYHHKTVKAIESMIIDGLLAAEPHMKMAERTFDAHKFLYLTDDILSRIQSSEEPELEEARKIFDRISERKLYRCVDSKAIDWPHQAIFREHVTSTKIAESASALWNTPAFDDSDRISTYESAEILRASGALSPKSLPLRSSDVIAEFFIIHYGKMEKNPLDSVQFYPKQSINCSQKATPGCYSTVLPPYFAQVLLLVYTKKQELTEAVQAGYRAILKDLEDQLGQESDLKKVGSTGNNAVDGVKIGRSGSMGVVPTPPATPMSNLHSRNASFTIDEGSNASPFSNNDFITVTRPTGPLDKETAIEVSVIKNDTRRSLNSTSSSKKRKADHHIEGGYRRRTRRRR